MTMTMKDLTLTADARAHEDPDGPRASIEAIHQDIDAVANCKALEGEPEFTLLGRDPVAPHLLLIWAAVRERFEPRHRKNNRAREIAVQMLLWKRQHPDIGMAQTPDDMANPLAEEEARVTGHKARLLMLRVFTFQQILRDVREAFQIPEGHRLRPLIDRAVEVIDAFDWFRHRETDQPYARVSEGVVVKAKRPIQDGDQLTIYLGEGGKMFARLDDEFTDAFRPTEVDMKTGNIAP